MLGEEIIRDFSPLIPKLPVILLEEVAGEG